jgi:hypothetical protein
MQSDTTSRPEEQSDFDTRIRLDRLLDLSGGAADAQTVGPAAIEHATNDGRIASDISRSTQAAAQLGSIA